MAFSTKFDLDTKALIPGSAGSVNLGATTSSDVLEAVRTNGAFPSRQIDLASIGLELVGGGEVAFGGGGKVSIGGSASGDLQTGVFDKAADVLARIALGDADELELNLADQPGMRYMMFKASYDAEARVSGSHPLGVFGAATFGVEGQRARLYAAVHRFAATEGANDVCRATFSSLKLPRHITDAAQISPGMHLITEIDGSLALKIGAQLGYDFNFIREATLAGLHGDVGLRIEAGVKAAIELELSGRYLLVLERPNADASIRLQLFKLRKKGLTFGLNLSTKIQPVVDLLPENVDDLVKAVFGVHGLQVVKDLHAIEKWTDPESDLSETVAGLGVDTGLKLLHAVTGLSPREQFDQARGVMLAALRKWDELPATVSSFLWSQFESGPWSAKARKTFMSSLTALASADVETRRKELTGLLSVAGIEHELAGRFLVAAADRGLAVLLDRSDDLREVAAVTLDILNGGVIERLQGFIAERLNLEALVKAVEETDFKRLDAWLVQRLSNFLDRKMRFEDLDEIRKAIHVVLRKRQEIYDKARQALARRYDFDLAFKYQTATSTSALIDATFDTSQMPAAKRLQQVVRDSNLDELLVTETPGVVLRRGVLSHGVTRQALIEVHLPYYDARTTSLTESLASVQAQEDGGRVLFYEVIADSRITKNRLKSQLAATASFPVRPGAGVRVHGVTSSSWSYQLLQIAPNLRRPELEKRIAPLALQYFPDHFPGGVASLSAFLTDFDRAVENAVHNGTDEFGDLLLSLDVSVPGSVVAAWFRSRGKDQARADARAASIQMQRSLQELIPFYFFRDLGKLHQNMEASPLLVFSALPALNQFRLEGDRAVQQDGPIWDVFDPANREFIINLASTKGKLGAILELQRSRLLAAGRTEQAKFFDPGEVGDFIGNVRDHANFVSLLRLVSIMAHGVEDALNDLRGFEANAETRPAKAIERLAEFGATVVTTFNKELSSIYGGDLLRPLGSLVFIEAARALDPAIATRRPHALLSLTVLKEERTYRMEQFLANQLPEADQVAVQQRLFSA